MNLPQDALAVAALKTLADDIRTTLDKDKTGLLEVMAEQGITGLAARLPDGTKVASLPYVGGEDRAQVVDEAALVAWMERNRPGEIVKTVRKETLKAILDAANAGGATGHVVDPATGEVIPGIGFGPSTPYTQVNFVHGKAPGEDGRELIREAWKSGALDVRDLLALPAGDGDG